VFFMRVCERGRVLMHFSSTVAATAASQPVESPFSALQHASAAGNSAECINAASTGWLCKHTSNYPLHPCANSPFASIACIEPMTTTRHLIGAISEAKP
jgi:hypothetical protein